MLYSVFFIALLLLLTVIFLAARIKILLEYMRKKGDDRLVISLYMFSGIIKYKYEASTVDFREKGIRLKWSGKKGRKEKQTRRESSFLDFREMAKNLDRARFIFERFLRGRFTVENLSLDIGFGTGDACGTGILTGSIWALVGMADALVSSNFKVEKRHIKVLPEFSRKVLNIDLYCIFSTKIVNIIIVGCKLGFYSIKHMLKRKKSKK